MCLKRTVALLQKHWQCTVADSRCCSAWLFVLACCNHTSTQGNKNSQQYKSITIPINTWCSYSFPSSAPLPHSTLGVRPCVNQTNKLQVEREAAELDWTQQSGRTVAGRQVVPCAPGSDSGRSGAYVLVKEAFEGGSGRLGGDSAALNHVRLMG